MVELVIFTLKVPVMLCIVLQAVTLEVLVTEYERLIVEVAIYAPVAGELSVIVGGAAKTNSAKSKRRTQDINPIIIVGFFMLSLTGSLQRLVLQRR